MDVLSSGFAVGSDDVVPAGTTFEKLSDVENGESSDDSMSPADCHTPTKGFICISQLTTAARNARNTVQSIVIVGNAIIDTGHNTLECHVSLADKTLNSILEEQARQTANVDGIQAFGRRDGQLDISDTGEIDWAIQTEERGISEGDSDELVGRLVTFELRQGSDEDTRGLVMWVGELQLVLGQPEPGNIGVSEDPSEEISLAKSRRPARLFWPVVQGRVA